MQYRHQDLAQDLRRLSKGDSHAERAPPGRLSSFTSTDALHHSPSTASRASRHHHQQQAQTASASRMQPPTAASHHQTQASFSGTIELTREDALPTGAPPLAGFFSGANSGLLRHPESQRLLLTGSSWGWMASSGSAAAGPTAPFLARSGRSSAASLFSHSALAFQELRRLVLAFLTGPDSRLFRTVDGMEVTDEELDDLLIAGGSFTLYHLQKLNLLSAQMASFGELIRIVRFLSRKSLTARERLFAYLNQHHVSNSSAGGMSARLCSLFSAPSSYPAGFHAPPASGLSFTSSLAHSPAIPSFSWADIDGLYIEGLAGDATLACLQALEDANPHLRLNEETPQAMCARLAELIKERFLSTQAALMKRKGDRYYALELASMLEGFEDFLASQPGSKAFAQKQASLAAAAAAAMAGQGATSYSHLSLASSSFSHPSPDHAYAYLDPLVQFLASPETRLFSAVLPIKSDELVSLLSLCYDDVDRTLWYLKQIDSAITRCLSGGAPQPNLPSSRLGDFAALKLAVFQFVQEDDRRKTELADWMNRTERGRKILVRDGGAGGRNAAGGASNTSSTASLAVDPSAALLSMAEIETLYRSTWSAVQAASGGHGSLVQVLQQLPTHLSFDSLPALIQYLLVQQSQSAVQARARQRAQDRAEVFAMSATLVKLLSPASRGGGTGPMLTQRHVDALLLAARSNRIDLSVHPLFNLAPQDHPTPTGRHLNADPASSVVFSGVLDAFSARSLFPALRLHLAFLLRANRSFDGIVDLVKAVEMCSRQTDDMATTMHAYLTAPARRGGGGGLFEGDKHQQAGKANSLEVDGLSHADMYLVLLASSAGLQSFQVLQRLAALRAQPLSEQLAFEQSPDCLRVSGRAGGLNGVTGVDVTNWPIRSLEELIARVGALWRAKYAPREEGEPAAGDGKNVRDGDEWADEYEAKQHANAYIVGGSKPAAYQPPVYDNVYTALSASAYTPAEDSEYLLHRRRPPVAGGEAGEWLPHERIELYEFITRPECQLLQIPGSSGVSTGAEEKSVVGASTLPPLSRSMLHSLLSAGGGVQRTLALLRSLESNQRSFSSFSLLLGSVHKESGLLSTLVETLVFLFRTFKGRRMMRDCFARDGQGGADQAKGRSTTGGVEMAPASSSTEDGLELELDLSPEATASGSSFPIDLEVNPSAGILLSDGDMIACLSSWVLAILPRLGHQLSVLYYIKRLLGLNGPVPIGPDDFTGLDGLADVLHTLYQRDQQRATGSPAGLVTLAGDRRDRVVVELTPDEEAWLEQEPQTAAHDWESQPPPAQSRPTTAAHRLTVTTPGKNSTLLADHTAAAAGASSSTAKAFDPLALPSTLGYANSSDDSMLSSSASGSLGLSPSDARDFFEAFSPPGHATRMRLGAQAHGSQLGLGTGVLDQADPFFVHLVRQQEAEAEEIMAYLKSGTCRLLDPRTPPIGSPNPPAAAATSPRTSVASSLAEASLSVASSRTASLATPSLVSTLQRSGGLGPLTLSKPRNQLARHLHTILRATARWAAEQQARTGNDGETAVVEDTRAQGDGQRRDGSVETGRIQPSEAGFNSLDVQPNGPGVRSSSSLLSAYHLPEYFVDFTNSPTLHLLQQLDLMETRFVSTSQRSAPNGLMSPMSPNGDGDDPGERMRLARFGFADMRLAGAASESVDAPNVSLLAQVLANRKAKALAVHAAVFAPPLAGGTDVPPSTGPTLVAPPAARDAPPSLSAYLGDLALLDHPSCRWIDILPPDPCERVEMIPSGTIPSYLLPKPPCEEDYIDGSDIRPEPIAQKDTPPSFRQSAIQLALALVKFDNSLPRRVQAVVSLDAPLLELITTLQNLQPQLGLVNTLLALGARRDGPPVNRIAPSASSAGDAAAGVSIPSSAVEDAFELSTVGDTPFPETPHPSFLIVLQPLLSTLHAHLLSIQSFYTKALPAYFQEVHPLLRQLGDFYPALYDALRAAQYVGTQAPQASTAHHPLHPHLMLTLPLLQASFHLLANFLTTRAASQLHPALFRLEAYTQNLHQFLTQMGPLSQWLERLMRAPPSALSPSMAHLRDSGLVDYRPFLVQLPSFLRALLPFVTSMQSHLRAYLPFSSTLHSQYATFVRPLLLPILPLLLPIETDRGVTFTPSEDE